MIEFLLPDSIPLWAGISLILFSYVTSAVTVAFGLGGGVMMLVALGSVLPPLAVIPVHGVVQFGSNAGRAYVMRAHTERRLFGFFVIGALIGIAIAAQIVVSVPQAALQALLALFILYTVWGPKLGKHKVPAPAFIGIVGFAFPEWLPLIAAMIATGFLGTATGKKVLEWMPERVFAIGFKTVLTLLAARLLWVGVSSLLAS